MDTSIIADTLFGPEGTKIHTIMFLPVGINTNIILCNADTLKLSQAFGARIRLHMYFHLTYNIFRRSFKILKIVFSLIPFYVLRRRQNDMPLSGRASRYSYRKYPPPRPPSSPNHARGEKVRITRKYSKRGQTN